MPYPIRNIVNSIKKRSYEEKSLGNRIGWDIFNENGIVVCKGNNRLVL